MVHQEKCYLSTSLKGEHKLDLVMGVLLGNLILFRTGYNIFCPEKMFNTFFTSMRKPNLPLTEKKTFFDFTLLADSVIHTLIKKYFFSQAPTVPRKNNYVSKKC